MAIPLQIDCGALLDNIASDVAGVWKPKKIYLGQPRIAPTTDTWAVIAIEAVEIGDENRTPVTCEVVHVVTIVGHFPWAQADNEGLELAKQQAANEMLARLHAASTYGEYYYPMVRKIAFVEEDEPQKRSFEVRIDFEAWRTYDDDRRTS